MTLELTVCGSAGSHTGPGRACSGYLLRSGDHAIMLDCGNGATANLQTVMDFADLDGVVVSHRHADHCVDLVGMFHRLRFSPGGPRHVDLYLAPGVLGALTALLSEDSAATFPEVYRCRDIGAGDAIEIGPFRIDLHPSVHSVPTVSMRITVGDLVVAFSADSAGGSDLVECATGADLFLCEATWQGDPEAWPPGVHLTSRAAGEVAARAEVGRLLLTHIQGGSDLERSLVEARETYRGAVDLAEDTDTWRLT